MKTEVKFSKYCVRKILLQASSEFEIPANGERSVTVYDGDEKKKRLALILIKEKLILELPTPSNKIVHTLVYIQMSGTCTSCRQALKILCAKLSKCMWKMEKTLFK